jgi:hypothetical protein
VCLSVIKWKIKTLYSYCEQADRMGKDYKLRKQLMKWKLKCVSTNPTNTEKSRMFW